MNPRSSRRWAVVCLFLTSCGKVSHCDSPAAAKVVAAPIPAEEHVRDNQPVDAIDVHPGESIQEALDRAAESPNVRRVVVHAGTYRPPVARQALIWFNARHDGIELVAEGEVVLTAANPDIADRSAPSFPAVVNHVVYFGEGVGPRTVLRGFRITGANNFVTRVDEPNIQPEIDQPRLQRTVFFYTDGGGIKIFGRSYPTIEKVEIYDNYSSPCGAGISIEHRGFTERAVTIRNCVFRNNRVPTTGAAIDLLDHQLGSSAVIENCLFVNNLANCSMDTRSMRLGTWKPEEGHGAITVFPHSKAVVRRSTFVGNRNGVDDVSEASVYERCIFWQNNAPGGWPTGPRYELDVKNAAGVRDCIFGGPVRDAGHTIDRMRNEFQPPDPDFDASYVPRSSAYQDAGYRPAGGTNDDSPLLDEGVASETSARSKHDEWNDRKPLEVILRGNDFRWHITYPGDDGQLLTEDDVHTQRHLYLPAGATVAVRLESDDYLYTVALPAFEVREMAIPDLLRHLHFKTTATGVSELRGDQLCGFAHSELMGTVVVLDRDEFLSWCRSLSSEND
jgi:heme/copper-type cytochrome/quinol oxidase subunit 2